MKLFPNLALVFALCSNFVAAHQFFNCADPAALEVAKQASTELGGTDLVCRAELYGNIVLTRYTEIVGFATIDSKDGALHYRLIDLKNDTDSTNDMDNVCTKDFDAGVKRFLTWLGVSPTAYAARVVKAANGMAYLLVTGAKFGIAGECQAATKSYFPRMGVK